MTLQPARIRQERGHNHPRFSFFYVLLLAAIAATVHGEATNEITAAQLFQRGKEASQAKRWSDAEESFSKITILQPTNAAAFAELGSSLYAQKRYAEAITNLERAQELKYPLTNGLYWLGCSYFKTENYQQATNAFQKYLTFRTNDSSAFYWLGSSLSRLSCYAEAVAACRSAIALSPTNAYYFYKLGYCLHHLKKYQEAINTFGQLLNLKPNDAYALRHIGMAYYSMENYSNAIVSLQKSVEIEPKAADSYYWLGWSLFKLRRYQEAVEPFQTYSKLRPDDADGYGQLAKVFWAGGRIQEAATNYVRAFELRPKTSQNLYLLSFSHLIAGDYEKAFEIRPVLIATLGFVLLASYIIGLAILISKSLRLPATLQPGLWFSLGWLVLGLEGQFVWLFGLGVITPWSGWGNPLACLALSYVPVIAVGLRFFPRHPWGGPFVWKLPNLSFRSIRIAGLSLLLLFMLGGFYSLLFSQTTNTPLVQNTAPMIVQAMKSNLLLAVLAMVICAPLAEEFVFRGLIYGTLCRWMSETWVVVVTAAVFAATHFQLNFFFPMFCLGLLAGLARKKTGSLTVPFLLHALNNALALLALKFTANN